MEGAVWRIDSSSQTMSQRYREMCLGAESLEHLKQVRWL